MNNPDPALIARLETKAAELKKLIEAREAKRPLILEFSGTPKSGKTSAISTLRLFLKRNGISVETFTERASVAPLRSKGHMNFNVWVSCASLQGMIEALDRDDIDVFILDRGLFDALVWNTWLEQAGKVTEKEAQALVSFFTMERYVRLVDLVCVMKCDPKVSIEREFTGQLTAKRGSIMDEKILRELNQAVDVTVKNHGSRFKRIRQIDTTNLETLEGVTKIATETLDTLHQFLDEPLCVVPRAAFNSEFKTHIPAGGFVEGAEVAHSFEDLVRKHKVFRPRSSAERDPNCIIPIPCAVVMFEESVLLLRRKDEGHSLHNTYAIWAGGHVVESDNAGSNILLECLKRELSEEIFIKDDYDLIPIGLVRTSEDERASRHIGVVYKAILSTPQVALALDQKEFRETRGKSQSGKLVDVKKLSDFYKEMGDWSKFIVDEFWPRQKPLFNNNHT